MFLLLFNEPIHVQRERGPEGILLFYKSYSWANEEPAWFCPRPHRIIFICRLIQVNEGAIITKLLVLPASLCGLACSF